MKQKTCKVCKDKFEPKQFAQSCCSVNCAIIHSKNLKLKNDAKKRIEERNILKEKIKTLSDYANELQREVNLIVRLLDKGHGCIATNSKIGQMHAGHYFSIGANPTLRFNLFNIWLQSMHSNTWKSGDTLRYQQGIEDTFGKDVLENINLLRYIDPIKLKTDDYKNITPIAKSIVKWLKLQDRQFTNEERLYYRDKFNQQLNIYKNDTTTN
jgi:hypothetical protein